MGLIRLRLTASPVSADESVTSLGAVLRDAAAIEREKEARATEAIGNIAPQLFGLTAGDGEDPNFRRITSPSTMRDLNPFMHTRMQQVCFFLAVTTPFGRRILRIMTDYVVGEGFQVAAEDPPVQAVIDRFWKDSVNNLEENIEAWTHELFMFGELCLPVAVNEVDGFTRIGYIDPQEIEAVEFSMMQTASAQEVSIPVAVRLVRRIGEAQGRRLEIIHVDEDFNSPTFGKLKGDCFYFAINKAKSASRGISELFALADWIDVFDQMNFDFADRVRMLNSFVWHYTVKGGDAAAVEAMRAKVTKSPPRQGGIQVTNDQVVIEARTPDLKGADMSEAARMVKLYGLGGAGMPATFFADPMDANRATAREMAEPTVKMLTSRQNVIKRAVTAVITYVLQQAIVHGVLPEGDDPAWTLIVPDLSIKDMTQVATVLGAVATAAGQAEDRGWIRSETAAQAFHLLLTQVGVKVATDEFDQAQAAKIKRDANNVNDLNPQKNLADAMRNLPEPPARLQ